MRAQHIGKELLEDVAHVVIALVESHFGTAGIAIGSTEHTEAHGLDVVNALIAKGDLCSTAASTKVDGLEFCP